MNASHLSLKEDFEVSCEELDILVEEAWEIEGWHGQPLSNPFSWLLPVGRTDFPGGSMSAIVRSVKYLFVTGAGFGGCTISIVENDAVNEFVSRVGSHYKERTGRTAEFYIMETGNGASEV